MKIEIELNTENAAFEDDRTSEVFRLLRRMADQVAEHATGGRFVDANGNVVGKWEITEDD